MPLSKKQSRKRVRTQLEFDHPRVRNLPISGLRRRLPHVPIQAAGKPTPAVKTLKVAVGAGTEAVVREVEVDMALICGDPYYKNRKAKVGTRGNYPGVYATPLWPSKVVNFEHRS